MSTTGRERQGTATGGIDLAVTTEIWASVQDGIKSRLGPGRYSLWFRNTKLLACDGKRVLVGVPSALVHEYLQTRLKGELTAVLTQVLGVEPEVDFKVDGKLLCELRESQREQTPLPYQTALVKTEAAAPSLRQERPSSSSSSSAVHGGDELNRHYTLPRFITGPADRLAPDANRLAYRAALAVVESPGQVYNPLLLHAEEGLGKTHLLQAIAQGLRMSNRQPREPRESHESYDGETRRAVRFIAATRFHEEYVRAIRLHDTARFRHTYRHLDVLVLDDIHQLTRKKSQTELLYTIDHLLNSGGQVVVSSLLQPSQLDLHEQLVSRLVSGLVVRLDLPAEESRAQIAQQHLEPGTDPGVARFLGRRCRRNVRELVSACVRLRAYAAVSGQALDVLGSRRALEDVLEDEGEGISLERIGKVVEAHFELVADVLRRGQRKKSIALPRQVAMYLARVLTEHSLAEIGRHFGGKCHTTVNFARQRIEQRMNDDLVFRNTIEALQKLLQ